VTQVVAKVNRGDIRRAVVVRTKQQFQRKDGTIVRFDDNACVLIDDKGEPLGTRIMGNTLLTEKINVQGLLLRNWRKRSKEIRY
jgi:ribosomal protein L14